MKRLIGVFTCAALLPLLAVPAKAADDPDSRASLKGITTIRVLVSVCEELDGTVSGTDLLTDAELRLRQSGIHVLAPEETGDRMTGGVLAISLSCYRPIPELRLFCVEPGVALCQYAALPRNPAKQLLVETWSTHDVLVGDSNNLWMFRRTRDTVRGFLDQFLNAYLAANPKPTGAR